MAGQTAGMRGITIALAAYAFLFILQLGAYVLTDILILLAQSLEVLSDVFVSAFLLLSIWWSRKPADEFHMFGHGRAQNVAALVAASIMVLFMGVEIFREAIPKLFQVQEAAGAPDSGLGLTVLLVSMAVLAVPLVEIFRGKGGGASVRAQKVQLLKDEIAYLPAIAGVALAAGGYPVADAAASVIIGAVIVLSGVYLFKDNVHYLVGRSPGREFLGKVESAAKSVKGVLGVHDLKAEYVGPGAIHAGFHIEVARGTPIEEVDRIVREVDRRVSEGSNCEDCIIHVDPAGAGIERDASR